MIWNPIRHLAYALSVLRERRARRARHARRGLSGETVSGICLGLEVTLPLWLILLGVI